MAIRFWAASGMALAAALMLEQPAKAQGFFSFYEMSPRQVVNMLEDDGYELRGPMVRRGDVYVCNVVSVSGRSVRLIVDARDGHILARYALRSLRRDGGDDDTARGLRPPRDIGDDADSGEGPATHREQQALGDLFNPPSRVYGNDSLFPSRPGPDAAPATRPKPHHAGKKHKEPSVAKAPAAGPTPEATPSTDAAAAPKPDSSPVAAVAPGSSTPELKKPAEATKPDIGPKPAASPEPAQAKSADADKAVPSAPVEPKPEPAAKPERSRKKLNDLPVDTLD
jgi:hypothetical protein